MAGNTSIENGIKGGRPKGRKNNKTLERELALERIRQRVFEATDVLVNGQLTNARGVSYLYKIEKTKVIGPKGGISYRAERPKLVTNEYEIENYLAGLIEEGDADDQNDPAATYYYITTEKPETPAAKELWDRALGKAPQAITGPDGGAVVVEFSRALQHEFPSSPGTDSGE